MKNHYHLIVSENKEGGLTQFLRKLNVGYANYFNERYKRSGTLFQGRTKRVLIERDAHFLHILHYVHLNPLDYQKDTKDWRSQNIRSAQRALTYLENYRWSSYRDYCGMHNFPSILSTNLFSSVFGNYRRTITNYVRDMEIGTFANYALE